MMGIWLGGAIPLSHITINTNNLFSPATAMNWQGVSPLSLLEMTSKQYHIELHINLTEAAMESESLWGMSDHYAEHVTVILFKYIKEYIHIHIQEVMYAFTLN